MTKNATYCDKHVSSQKCIFFVVYIDLYVVATHSDGCQGAYSYWVYPLRDDSAGYFQPVWMAVML